ncbi:MAG: flagellar filament capping protein FliD [Alistipes sp.]|nr:flagellar filament capping protein FliD [Alistipes sp.]
MAVRLSGLASGLDTDSIVKELVAAYSTKKDNVVKAQTKLEWTQDAWKSMNNKIYSFYSTKLSSMRFSSSFKLKTSTISNSSVAKVTASSKAVNGTQTLKVKNLATSGYLTGSVLSDKDDKKLSGSSKLKDVKGLSDLASYGSIEVKSGSKTSKVDLSGDMTLNQLAVKFKEAGLEASFDEKNQRFFISAATSGKDADFAITAATTDAVDTLKGLGIYAVTDSELAKYKKDAAIDVDAMTAAAYEKQKTAHTDADTQKKLLEEQEKTLTKQKEALETQKEYLAFKKSYMADLKFDGVEKPVLDDEGKPKKDEEGNEIKYTEYSYASDSRTAQDIAKDMKDEVERLENKLKDLDKDNLTADEEKQKATLQNQLKAAKEVQAEIGNDTLVPSDVQAIVAKTSDSLDETVKKLGETSNKLTETKDILSDPDKLEQYVTDRNTEIDTKNADLEQRLNDYYTNLKNTAQGIVDAHASGAEKMATRIVGEDSEIELNGATFTSNTNSFDINGLTIQATAVTGDESVTITTDTDIDGIYNMVKDFFTSYNELIKSMDTAYNAPSASKYEPLTDDEKESMTDTQIEKWEAKIKDSVLRRDNTLGTLSSLMKTIMSKSYSVGGKNYSLASFGIKTANYFASGDNEKGIYHIDGDPDDSTTAGNQDKLRAAIASDPDTFVEFFSKLSTELYTKLTDKMSSSTLSSAYTVYNDKQMKTQYSKYTSDIKNWEDKISAYEEKYYKQFSAMEQALAKLNSQQSQLSGLFG